MKTNHQFKSSEARLHQSLSITFISLRSSLEIQQTSRTSEPRGIGPRSPRIILALRKANEAGKRPDMSDLAWHRPGPQRENNKRTADVDIDFNFNCKLKLMIN